MDEWENAEFDDLAAELRGRMGGEFRAEAEALEEDAARYALRRRSLTDVALELMNRGDEIGISGAGASFTGSISHAAGDLVILTTPHSLVNVNLSGPVALRILRRANAGGHGRSSGSPSFRARMLELEMSGESLEIRSSASPHLLAGTITAVGVDHLVVVDRDRIEWFVPLSTIAFALQR